MAFYHVVADFHGVATGHFARAHLRAQSIHVVVIDGSDFHALGAQILHVFGATAASRRFVHRGRWEALRQYRRRRQA